jgi:hypothetical protein
VCGEKERTKNMVKKILKVVFNCIDTGKQAKGYLSAGHPDPNIFRCNSNTFKKENNSLKKFSLRLISTIRWNIAIGASSRISKDGQ